MSAGANTTHDPPLMSVEFEVAIVVANGAVPTRAALDSAWPGWDDGRHLVVAADGGSSGAAAMGLNIDVVVGDLDSIEPASLEALRTAGVPIEAWPHDKDASDTELALRAALDRRPRRIVVLGAAGGVRLDHALANVALLGLAELAGRDIAIIDGTTRMRLVAGPGSVALTGRIGDIVSLLPAGAAAEGIRTDGLAFPLVGETLPVGSTRGLSNVRTATTAHVDVGAGRLLVVEVVPRPEVLP